jgi:hypothetical protein
MKLKITRTLLGCLALVLFTSPLVCGQGGTGRQPGSSPSTKTQPDRPPATSATPVARLEGTAWGFEARESTKLLGKVMLEFAAGGKVFENGETQTEATWKQTGRRVVLTFGKGSTTVTMEGTINGNQISGTMEGKEDNGALHHGRWTANRATAEMLADLNEWKSIKDSNNPEDFKNYLAKHPYSYLVGSAVDRMKMLDAIKSVKTPESASEPVPGLAGTTWAVEARQGSKLVAKGILEFLPEGKVRTNGEIEDGTWKQDGAKVSLTFPDGQQEGTINGKEMSGKITVKVDGVSQTADWTGRQADDELLAEFSYWKSIKDSSNADEFKKYLAKYPYGVFVESAISRMKTLDEKKKTDPSQ